MSHYRPLKKKWHYRRGKSDRICFVVDKDIQLLGVEHFGREGSGYTVNVVLSNTSNGLCVVKKSGSYSSKLKHCDTKTFYGFDVLFDNPVHLKQNVYYELVSLIKGDSSFYGEKGKSIVNCHGMYVSFRNSIETDDSNGTSTDKGQFPTLLFQLLG